MKTTAARALSLSVAAWFVALVMGLWAFGLYILALYGIGAATGNWERWNVVLPSGHGYSRGDTAGNLALGVHLLMAVFVTFAGAIQLVPALRAKAPAFHRWNGRIFIAVAFVIAGSGLYIAFTRGAVAGAYMAVGNTLNAVLLMSCAAQALRFALKRRFDIHRRWALRAFVLMLGVFFYRLGMMLWFVANHGPVGHTEAFDGPFDIFLAFAHVLLPLAILELNLLARERGGAVAKFAMAGVMAVATVATAAGGLFAAFGLWLPRL
ncbi:DUF2306 domain-containing protein [Caulobacter sp. 1776]|uniref:DUF2306 domain-containing protein n=1 Tax=Caulobacter sp. 1776 TaxID=3156420 RepID=UPI00339435E6